MNINKEVTINGQVFRMWQDHRSKWVFVESKKVEASFPAAKIVGNKIIELSPRQAINDATNQELANAWLNF